MGDELILLGTIRLLLKQGKEIFVVSANNVWLKEFLGQFIDVGQITFIDELPRGFRSAWVWLIKKRFTQLKYFFKVDAVILGGGEILTEESSHSYYYRFWSIRPALFFKKALYLMGGIQIPKLFWNKFLFKTILRKAKHIFSRDLEEIEHIKRHGYDQVDFFMDTSYFAIPDRTSYKKESKQEYIIVNINRGGRLFMEDFIEDIKKYLHMWYKVIYAPICAGRTDDDTKYFYTIQDILSKDENFVLYDRRKNFHDFLKLLWGAKKVISARLHLFLIASFMGLETKAYPYQKKVSKMQNTLEEIER